MGMVKYGHLRLISQWINISPMALAYLHALLKSLGCSPVPVPSPVYNVPSGNVRSSLGSPLYTPHNPKIYMGWFNLLKGKATFSWKMLESHQRVAWFVCPNEKPVHDDNCSIKCLKLSSEEQLIFSWSSDVQDGTMLT